MNNLFTKFHTTIILIIFITVICLLGLGLKEDFIISENFTNFKRDIPKFNIDTQILNNKEHLGWKSFLPLNLSWFVMTVFILLSFEGLPPTNGYCTNFCYFDPNYLFFKDYQK